MKVIIDNLNSTELKVYTIKNVFTSLAIERMLELAAMANEAIYKKYSNFKVILLSKELDIND